MLKLPKGIKKLENSLANFQKIQMVKFSKDNKIKNQKIQNLQIIKTKQNKKK